jgi:hypothetical protein
MEKSALAELAYTRGGLQFKEKTWPGSNLSNPAMMIASIKRSRRSGLAPAAGAPGRAAGAAAPEDAAAASASAAAAATTAASATAATAATATAATPGYLNAVSCRFGALFVEHIESRQTDVGDFLFTECDLMVR